MNVLGIDFGVFRYHVLGQKSHLGATVQNKTRKEI